MYGNFRNVMTPSSSHTWLTFLLNCTLMQTLRGWYQRGLREVLKIKIQGKLIIYKHHETALNGIWMWKVKTYANKVLIICHFVLLKYRWQLTTTRIIHSQWTWVVLSDSKWWAWLCRCYSFRPVKKSTSRQRPRHYRCARHSWEETRKPNSRRCQATAAEAATSPASAAAGPTPTNAAYTAAKLQLSPANASCRSETLQPTPRKPAFR